MHRIILNAPVGSEVDHIDGCKLNNQKSNLRLVSRRGNCQNLHINKSSIYPGVSLHQGKWLASIFVEGKKFLLGTYNSQEEAYKVYLIACDFIIV
jgi:hypothetical protein